MKKQILALSMVATSGLMAQEGPMPDQAHEQNMGDNCNTCGTCCNNPRPCVDCECYVPQFYNMQCDCGFSLDLEFLYWYGRETGLSYAADIVQTYIDGADCSGSCEDATPSTELYAVMYPRQFEHLNTSWDPGFRLGIGFNSSCDGWDYNLVWTWYRNTRSDATCASCACDCGSPTTDTASLINPWVNPSFSYYGQFNEDQNQDSSMGAFLRFDRVGAYYRLRYNQIDFDLGRKYWLSKCFNMRTYAGLRGAWTHVKFETTSTVSDVGDTALPVLECYNFTDQFNTRAWGVGIIAGIEPTWYFSECFGLYAKAGTGAIWGDFEVKKTEDYRGTYSTDTSPETGDLVEQPICYKATSCSKHAQMTGLLDLSLGLRWESSWCYDRYRTTVDMGWEHHILFDQNHRNKLTGYYADVETTPEAGEPWISGFTGYEEATGNLGFGGFTLRLNFDF